MMNCWMNTQANNDARRKEILEIKVKIWFGENFNDL